MDKQWPDQKKRALADIIIENIDKEETLIKVRELWENKFNLKLLSGDCKKYGFVSSF
jgi:hypothetical protein